MFTPAVQRIVWKEFRAQRAIWFGIALELIMLQLVRAFSPDRFPINLVSLACVLTGIFAMTSSALLFAGESEAQTDGFLRQLPFRSRDLILGKLGFNIAAVASFLGFSLLAAILINAMQSDVLLQSGEFDETLAYANSILGLWAWGIFYSLLTRKVMWTLLGAALTEIVINAALHGVLKGHWFSDSKIYVIYQSIDLVVFLVDAWLLSRWYAGARVSRGVSHPLAVSTADESQLKVSAPPLPWAKSWKLSSRVGMALAVIWYILALASAPGTNGGDVLYLALVPLSGVVGAIIGAIVVIWIRTFRPISSDHSPGLSELRPVSESIRFSIVLKQSLGLLGLLGVCILALALGIVVGFCGLVLLIVVFVEWRPRPDQFFYVSGIGGVAFAVGFVLWGVERLLDSSEKKHTSRIAIRALQFAQSTFQSINRSWGSLLWIEVRRVVPFLNGGVVVLGAIAVLFSLSIRETRWSLGLISLLITSYTFGLMTMLPDRSQGTLLFLIERGVPAWRILTSKLVVWGLTLVLLAIIPSLLFVDFWARFRIEQSVVGVGYESSGPGKWMGSPAMLFVGGFNLGLFAIGALSAAWIRRPILAVIGGLVGVILWGAWCVVLSENDSLFGMAIIWPLGMWIIGYFASGTTTLLEQANWKSKVRRVAWVMLIVGGSFYWLRDFRTHEIPTLMSPEPCQSLRNRYAENVRLNASRPPGNRYQSGWATASDAESTILQLHLDQPSCDLDVALKTLATGLEVTSENARDVQVEAMFIEVTKIRRLVLSAIRRWANHPAQTAALLEQAELKYESLARGNRFSAIDLLASQYHDAVQAIESGPNSSRLMAGQPPHNDNSLIRTILKLAGEQERIRRLVDFQFSLLPYYLGADPLQANSYALPLETTCVNWTRNTSLSLNALGVNLPAMVYVHIFREEMRQIHISSLATVLVLKLQHSRIKNGQFPSTLIEVMQPGQIDVSSFGYEPQGFDRNLRISPLKALPAHQPVIYYRGEAPHQGLDLVDPGVDGRAFYRARGWILGDLVYMPRKDMIEKSSQLQLSAQTEFLASAEGPVKPYEIRFVSLGSPRDEDRLCLPPDQRVDVSADAVIQQNSLENRPIIRADGTMQRLTPAAEPPSPDTPSPEIPPVPPPAQLMEGTEE